MKCYFLSKDRDQLIAAKLMGLATIEASAYEEARELIKELQTTAADCALIIVAHSLAAEWQRLEAAEVERYRQQEKPLICFLPAEGDFAQTIAAIPAKALGLKVNI